MSETTNILSLLVNLETMKRVGDLRSSQDEQGKIAAQQYADASRDNQLYGQIVDALRNAKRNLDSRNYCEGLSSICAALISSGRVYAATKSADIKLKITQVEEALISLLEHTFSEESLFKDASSELAKKLTDAKATLDAIHSQPFYFAHILNERIVLNKELRTLDMIVPRKDIYFKPFKRLAFSKGEAYPFMVYSELDPGADWTIFKKDGKDEWMGGLFSDKYPGAIIVGSNICRYILIFGKRDHSYQDFYVLKLSTLTDGLTISTILSQEHASAYGRAGVLVQQLRQSLGEQKFITPEDILNATEVLKEYVASEESKDIPSTQAKGTGTTLEKIINWFKTS